MIVVKYGTNDRRNGNLIELSVTAADENEADKIAEDILFGGKADKYIDKDAPVRMWVNDIYEA